MDEEWAGVVPKLAQQAHQEAIDGTDLVPHGRPAWGRADVASEAGRPEVAWQGVGGG